MKKTILIITTLIIFVIIFLGITFLESLKKDTTPEPTPQPNPYVQFDKEANKKLLDTVKTRPTQSPNDLVIREQIISALKGESGIIFENEDYYIEYVNNANSFMVEIKTLEVDHTKQEVINYFKSRGLSENGICKLPLVFYLNFEIAKQYAKTNQKFSQIPDFCKL